MENEKKVEQVSITLPSAFATVRPGALVPFAVGVAPGGLMTPEQHDFYCAAEGNEEFSQPVTCELALKLGTVTRVNGEDFVRAEALDLAEQRVGTRQYFSPSGEFRVMHEHVEHWMWVRVSDLVFTHEDRGEFVQVSRKDSLLNRHSARAARQQGVQVGQVSANRRFALLAGYVRE